MRYNSSMYTDLTDEELIRLVQDGNEMAFGQLADRHSFRIWQLVVLNSRQTRDAEEIFQDIWIAVWENIGGLRKVSSFGAWLQKIAYTACRRYYSTQQRTRGEILQSTDQLAETMDQDALVRFREAELRSTVREAVHHLPEKVRSVAVLYYLEMSPVKEISEELNLAVGTVKTRLREIRTLLRTEFDVEEVKRSSTLSSEQEVHKRTRSKIKEDFGMELTFERDTLLSALRGLQGLTSGQDVEPILSDMRIRAEADTIDLEVSIKMKVAGTVKTEGTTTLPVDKLMDTLKRLPTDKPIHLVKTTDERVEIISGEGVYKIIGTTAEGAPQLPSVEVETFSMSGQTLRGVIQKTAYAASTEAVRSFLNSLYFNFLDDRTEIVATDGKRLVVTCVDPLKPQGKINEFIVPLKAIREIPSTFSESVEVEISVFENQIRFTDGAATLTTPLVDREYPNYHKIIPQTSTGSAAVSREALLHVAQRMAKFANPKNYGICLEIDAERIRVSANTPKSEESAEIVPVTSGTGRVRLGFDARLLIDTLTHIETESVLIKFSQELNPVLIKPMDDDRYIALVMPLLLD